MNDPQTIFNAMFDPETFRATGHALIDLLADELGQNLRGEQPVLRWHAPQQEDARWRRPLPLRSELQPAQLLAQLRELILPGCLAIHHPHNFGHQVATPLPLAALCDLVAALSNQAMAVYEVGPSATMLERQVIRWMSALIGWPSEQVNGVLTSGGAQANLTALLAARQHAGGDTWQRGVAAGPALRILASEHSHYSIARAAGIMGLGTDAVIGIAADGAGRMSPDAIAQAQRQCRQRGERIIAVVVNAGCTPTGSIDPLQAVGEYCRAQQLWLHVDGAHGASALLSARRRPLLDGIELADSVVWDGHKLLYMPAAVSAVLFRQPQHGYLAFAQQASYLFQSDDHAIETFNNSYRTLECTKRMMALKLWAAFSLYGVEGLGALVDHVFESAARLAEKIAAHPEFELLMPPQTNIVCFRHRIAGASGAALNRHQAELRRGLVEGGQFHLTQVELSGTLWLRATLMNPLTEERHMTALLDGLCRVQESSSSAE